MGSKVAMAGLLFVFLALVAVILFPVFAKVRYGNGPNRVGVHLEQLAVALQQYAENNNGDLPPMPDGLTARKALAPYAASNEWGTRTPANNFVNPLTGEAFAPNPALSGRPLKSFQRSANHTIAFYDPRPYDDGSHVVLMLNGSVRNIPAAQWAAVKHLSKFP